MTGMGSGSSSDAQIAAWRYYLGAALVGIIAATVSATLGFDPSGWKWWAVMGGCIVSGWTRLALQ